MVEAGAFDGHLRQHVEFIRGEIREMNPIGSFHAQVVGDLTDWSYDVVPRKEMAIRVQTTLRMPLLNSAPEPDLLWVRRRSYSQRHPEPTDVMLLVEVSESTLADDRGVKLQLYAQAGIQDYWIANLLTHTVEVYRQPVGTNYCWSQTFDTGQSISPLALPTATLAINYIFPDS